MAQEALGQPPVVAYASSAMPDASVRALDFPLGVNKASFDLLNSAPGTSYDFRVLVAGGGDDGGVRVTPSTGVVASQPSTVSVSIDRQALLAADVTPFLAINTTAGPLRIPVNVATALDGTWVGSFAVDSPVPLSSFAATISIREARDGTLSGVVKGSESPIWSADVAVTGGTQAANGDGGVEVSLAFGFAAPQASLLNPAVPARLRRDIALTGTRTASAQIQGTWQETIGGLLADAGVVVRGTFTMKRVAAASDSLKPQYYGGSASPVPNVYADIPSNASTVGGIRAAMPIITFSGDLAKCGQTCSVPVGASTYYGSCSQDTGQSFGLVADYFRVSAIGYFSKTEDGQLAGSHNPALARRLYYDFARSELSGNPYASADSHARDDTKYTAYDAKMLECSQFWLARGILAGGAPSLGAQFLSTVEVTADAALYLGNAYMARASDEIYSSDIGFGRLAEYFKDAADQFLGGLYTASGQPLALLDPSVFTVLQSLNVNSLAAPTAGGGFDAPTAEVRADGEAVRRTAQVLKGYMTATHQRALYVTRASATQDGLEIVKSGLAAAYIAAASIGTLTSKVAPPLWTGTLPWKNDLGELRQAWQDLDDDYLRLQSGFNEFGVRDSYVPFYYLDDNGQASSDNFIQILSLAIAQNSTWNASFRAAQDTQRAFESKQEDAEAALLQVKDQYDSQLSDICGGRGIENLQTQCGIDYKKANASQLAQALLAIDSAAAGVEAARAAMANIYSEVEIEQQRAAQQAGVTTAVAQIRFSSGQRNTLIDFAINQISAGQQLATDVLGGLGSCATPWGCAIAVGAATATGVVNFIANQLKAGLELTKGLLQATTESDIVLTQGLSIGIDSAAAIKTKLLQLITLRLALEQAALNLAQAQGQAIALTSRAERLLDSRNAANALAGRKVSRTLSYRLFANQSGLRALRDGESAVRIGWFAARALSYKLNQSLAVEGEIRTARSPADLSTAFDKLAQLNANSGTAGRNRITVSLRRDLLGQTTSATDAVSGQTLATAEQFRQFVASPVSRDTDGNFHVRFMTATPGSPVANTAEGAARIKGVWVNLIGDGFGADVSTAQVKLTHGGTSYLRARKSGGELIAYNLGAGGGSGGAAGVESRRLAIPQASINAPNHYVETYKDVVLTERAVLAGPWELVIDQTTGTPLNKSLDISHMDDIEITLEYQYYSVQ